MLFEKHYGKRNIFLLSVLLCLVLALQVFAQAQPGAVNFKDNPAMPEGVKGERIKAFIAAVNSEKPDRVCEFFETNCTEKFKDFVPMDQHISVFQRFYQSTGGIEFQSVRSLVPEVKKVTAVIVKGRTIGTWRVNFMKGDGHK